VEDDPGICFFLRCFQQIFFNDIIASDLKAEVIACDIQSFSTQSFSLAWLFQLADDEADQYHLSGTTREETSPLLDLVTWNDVSKTNLSQNQVIFDHYICSS